MGLDLGIGEIFGAIGAIGSVVGSITQASAAKQAAQAQEQEADYQAEVAQNNQKIAAQNAQYAAQSGEAQLQQTQLQTRSQTSAVAAALAANGLDINTGSPAQVRQGQEQIGQLEGENVKEQELVNVYGYQTQETNYAAQAGLYQLEAQNAAKAAEIAPLGSLFSGAGSLASKWSSWQTETGGSGITSAASSFVDPLTGLTF